MFVQSGVGNRRPHASSVTLDNFSRLLTRYIWQEGYVNCNWRQENTCAARQRNDNEVGGGQGAVDRGQGRVKAFRGMYLGIKN